MTRSVTLAALAVLLIVLGCGRADETAGHRPAAPPTGASATPSDAAPTTVHSTTRGDAAPTSVDGGADWFAGPDEIVGGVLDPQYLAHSQHEGGNDRCPDGVNGNACPPRPIGNPCTPGLVYNKVVIPPWTAQVTIGGWTNRWCAKDGVPEDGAFDAVSPDGQTVATGMMRDGKPNGQWRYFYDDGKPAMEGTWKLGVPEGKWTFRPRGGAPVVACFTDGERTDCP